MHKTRIQIRALEKVYNEHMYPRRGMKRELAVSIGLTEKQVSDWFCRRRKKDEIFRWLKDRKTSENEMSATRKQDRGSGLRQYSCGSSNSACESKEVESKKYSGQDFPAAYPADKQRQHPDGNYSDMDDVSSGTRLPATPFTEPSLESFCRASPSAHPTAAAAEDASFSDEEIFRLLKISEEAFRAKLGITNSFLEEACTKLFLGFVKLFLTLSERSPAEDLQKALNDASDLSKVGLPMDSFKQQLELIKRTKDDFDALASQRQQVEQTQQTLTLELAQLKAEMQALQDQYSEKEKQYEANEVLRARFCKISTLSLLPGIFVALALRFDVSRGKGSQYFKSAFLGYTFGLALTIVVMNWFQAAQPALLYIVPAVIGFLATHCIWNGEVKELLAFDESKTAAAASEDGKTETESESTTNKDD